LEVSEESDSLTGLHFFTYNDYTKKDPVDSVWEHIAEPFRESFFEAVLDTPDSYNGVLFSWEIDGEVVESNKKKFSHTFTKIGPTIVKVTASRGQTKEEYAAMVVVKYVRREIRSLTDEDRTKLLDAMEIIYRISDDEGRQLYGPNFRSIASFTKEHLNGAGRKECDHWHDDAGVMNHHIAFTLEFEECLQLIEPSLALPYWEYTYDEMEYNELESSPIFQDDWFGPMNPLNSEHIVVSGRWKFLQVPIAGDDFDVFNPWGFLKSPWNTNPSPYLARNKYVNQGNSLSTPDCHSFYTFWAQDKMSRINNMFNGATHGPVHVKIGGEWGLGDDKVQFAKSYGFSSNLLLVFKVLWRMGYARCPETCSAVAVEECVCTAPKEIYESKGMTARDVLTVTGVLKYSTEDSIYWNDDEGVWHITDYEDSPGLEMRIFEKILDTLANPGYVGEMYTSSAPSDPTFWLIHPTVERLLNWRRLLKQYHPLDETWDYFHEQSKNPTDNGWVCDWNDLDEYSLPNCRKEVCNGHKKYDELEFQFLHTDRTFTNWDLYNYIDPTNIDLPYIYDNYRWAHCENSSLPISFKINGYNAVQDLIRDMNWTFPNRTTAL